MLKEPESMDELVYYTNRDLDNGGEAVCWVRRGKCPKCGKGMMGKPRNPKTGKAKIRASEYVCPECGNKKLSRVFSQVSVSQNIKEKKTIKTQAKNSDLEDPKSLAREMDRATSNSKADYGEDFKEVKSRLEKGESPVSIETKMRRRVGEKMSAH